MSILSSIAAVALVLSIALIVEGACALWTDGGDDERRADGIVTAGSGAVLFFCFSGVLAGVGLE